MTALILLIGFFLLSTAIVCACPGGHGKSVPDTTDLDTWTMTVQIQGNTESSMNIGLIDYAKIKNDLKRNPKGIRQIFYLSMKAGETRARVTLYNDDSKVHDSITWYSEWRRIRRHSKIDFENKEYEDTTLTLKQIMDAAVQLTDRDQVTIKDTVVFVQERCIDLEKVKIPVPLIAPDY